MTLTVARLPVREARIGLVHEAVGVAGLALTSTALLLLTWGTWGDIGADTGYDFVAGSFVAHGHLPYSDFTYYYGPLAPAVLGLAARLGGDGLGPPLAVGLVGVLAIIGLTYLLGRALATPLGGMLAGVITAGVAFAPTNFSFVLPHAYSATFGVTAVLAMLVSLDRRARGGGSRWLFLAGGAAGLAMLTRPEFAGAAALSAAGWILASDSSRPRLGEAWRFVGPAVLIPALAYGPFLATIGWHRLVTENLYPVKQLSVAGENVVRISAPLTAASGVDLAWHLLLYGCGVVVLLALTAAMTRSWLRFAAGSITALAAVGALGVLAEKPETVRFGMIFAYAWLPAGATIAAVFLALRLRKRVTAVDRTAFSTAIALAVVAAKTYAAFYLFSHVPQSAAYAAPLAAAFLVWFHLTELGTSVRARRMGAVWLAFLACAGCWLTVQAARTETGVVSGPGGSLAAPPQEASAYEQVLHIIEHHTAPGDPVLIAPQLTALYTLSDRRDPLRQISLLPGALPDRQAENDAVAQLRSSGVQLAVIDRHVFTEYGQTHFGGSFDRQVATWIQGAFIHVRTVSTDGADGRTIDIWLRRGRT